MRIRTIILLTAMTAALSACGQSGAGANGQASGNAAGSNETVTNHTAGNPAGSNASGSNPAVSAEAPMPGGLPAYPNVVAGSRADGTVHGGPPGSVMFQTTDRPQQVIAFYAEAAERAGLGVLMRTDNGREAAISLGTADRQGSIDIIVADMGEGRPALVGITTRRLGIK